ncbi:MAG: lasso peptide biosynthesis B2 protein [Sphingomonas sp.]
MTFWRILPHATVCMAGDAVILLDIRQDRYFLVPRTLTAVTTEWLSSADGREAPSGLAAMLERSAIRRPADPAASRERCDIALPMTLEERVDRQSISLGDHVRVGGIVAATWFGLRLTPLSVHLEYLARRSARIPRSDGDTLRARSRAFQQARRLNPIARNCLLDSLALARWLSAEGHACRIVFGVTATPFAAHCWVQDKDTLLNDHYDRVSRFTPIYAS